MLNHAMTQISASDKAAFERDGFLIVRQALSPAYIADCCAAAQAWIDSCIQGWQEKGLIKRDYSELDFRSRFLKAWRDAGEPYYSRSPRKEMIDVAPQTMFHLLQHEALLDIAEQILDTANIVSHGVFNLRPKAPNQRFTDTPWHQDAQYFPAYKDARMLNMWFPMHDVDVENSCLAFAPGIHKRGLFANDEGESNNGFIGLSPEIAAEMPSVAAELQVGDVVIFTNTTPHVALSNKTNSMRWSWDLRFIDLRDADAEVMKLGSIVRHQDASQIVNYQSFIKKWQRAEW